MRGTSHDARIRLSYTSWVGEEENEWSPEWGADKNGAEAWQQVWWCYDEEGCLGPRLALYPPENLPGIRPTRLTCG